MCKSRPCPVIQSTFLSVKPLQTDECKWPERREREGELKTLMWVGSWTHDDRWRLGVERERWIRNNMSRMWESRESFRIPERSPTTSWPLVNTHTDRGTLPTWLNAILVPVGAHVHKHIFLLTYLWLTTIHWLNSPFLCDDPILYTHTVYSLTTAF